MRRSQLSQFNRPNENEITMRSSHARPRLSPFGPSHRPAPQPAMAQRSTQQPGTWNLSSPPHPSSSVCDEDLVARGHTQACSSILFTCILTLFTQHLFNPHSPYSSWSLRTSCRSPFIGADLPLLPLFLPPHSYSSLFALAFHPLYSLSQSLFEQSNLTAIMAQNSSSSIVVVPGSVVQSPSPGVT